MNKTKLLLIDDVLPNVDWDYVHEFFAERNFTWGFYPNEFIPTADQLRSFAQELLEDMNISGAVNSGRLMIFRKKRFFFFTKYYINIGTPHYYIDNVPRNKHVFAQK